MNSRLWDNLGTSWEQGLATRRQRSWNLYSIPQNRHTSSQSFGRPLSTESHRLIWHDMTSKGTRLKRVSSIRHQVQNSESGTRRLNAVELCWICLRATHGYHGVCAFVMSMCFVLHLYPAASRKLGLMVRNVSEVKSVKAQGPGKDFRKFQTASRMYSVWFCLVVPAELNGLWLS